MDRMIIILSKKLKKIIISLIQLVWLKIGFWPIIGEGKDWVLRRQYEKNRKV